MKYPHIAISALIAVGLIGEIRTASPSSYPTHAVTLMVPYGAGGTVDSQLRALAKASEGHLGQPIIIENKASASGTLAAEVTAAAPADGYTITTINTSVLRLPFMTKTSYDPCQDFMLRQDLCAALPAVHGDRVEIQQVLINLVMNGMEAMDAIDQRGRNLLIRSHQNGDQVLVAVQDSGTGIDAASIDRLFNSFYTTKPGGLGMGLSICRSIIEAHGGKLWASQNAGPGATFQFTLQAAA
jgi:signal transduction histidine kinase